MDKTLEQHYEKTLARFGIPAGRVNIRHVLAPYEPAGADVFPDGEAEWRYDGESALDEAVEQAAVLALAIEVHHQLCGMYGDGDMAYLQKFHDLCEIVKTAWAYRLIAERLGEEKAWSELRSIEILAKMLKDAGDPLQYGFALMTTAAIRTVLGQRINIEFPSGEWRANWESLWAEVQRLVALPPDPALFVSLPKASGAEYSVSFDGDKFLFEANDVEQ